MSIFSKLFTAVRGLMSEAGEAMVDNQAIRIMEQEIRDARDALNAAKENLVRVMAEQMGIERTVKKLQRSMAEYEAYAIKALDKGDETLAVEIAEKIAELENELATQQSLLDSYNSNIATLKQSIRSTESKIKALEREVSIVKTTASVQKASSAAAAKFSGSDSSLRSATDSLARIKAKQQQRADQIQAAMTLQKETAGDELQGKLREAGLLNTTDVSSNSVLERLKKQRQAT